MGETTVEIYRIPTPASDADVVKYTHLRLNALRTNPEAYTSTYEDSSLLTHDQWRDRLETVGRTTLAARGCPSGGDHNTRVAEEHAEWVGTLSVLHPVMLQLDDLPYLPRLAEAVKAGTVKRYLLVGMWVHPSARKQGIGRILIQDAIELVREAPDSTFDQPKDETVGEDIKKTKVVFLKVFAANEGAQRLYRQVGFVEETGYEGVPKDIWMSFTL